MENIKNLKVSVSVNTSDLIDISSVLIKKIHVNQIRQEIQVTCIVNSNVAVLINNESFNLTVPVEIVLFKSISKDELIDILKGKKIQILPDIYVLQNVKDHHFIDDFNIVDITSNEKIDDSYYFHKLVRRRIEQLQYKINLSL